MDFKLHDSLIKERMGVNAGKIKVDLNDVHGLFRSLFKSLKRSLIKEYGYPSKDTIQDSVYSSLLNPDAMRDALGYFSPRFSGFFFDDLLRERGEIYDTISPMEFVKRDEETGLFDVNSLTHRLVVGGYYSMFKSLDDYSVLGLDVKPAPDWDARKFFLSNFDMIRERLDEYMETSKEGRSRLGYGYSDICPAGSEFLSVGVGRTASANYSARYRPDDLDGISLGDYPSLGLESFSFSETEKTKYTKFSLTFLDLTDRGFSKEYKKKNASLYYYNSSRTKLRNDLLYIPPRWRGLFDIPTDLVVFTCNYYSFLDVYVNYTMISMLEERGLFDNADFIVGVASSFRVDPEEYASFMEEVESGNRGKLFRFYQMFSKLYLSKYFTQTKSELSKSTFTYINTRNIEEYVLPLILDIYQEDLYFKSMEVYNSEVGKEYATAFMTKRNIPQKYLDAMSTSPFLSNGFSYVEYDESVDLSKLVDINTQWGYVYRYLPSIDGLVLRFRKILNHKAWGLYYGGLRCLVVDVRHPSSMVHEYGHAIDYNFGEGKCILSLQGEFRKILAYYTKVLPTVADIHLIRSLEYYLTPTEVFARAFEMFFAGMFPRVSVAGSYDTLVDNGSPYTPYFNILGEVYDYFVGLFSRLGVSLPFSISKEAYISNIEGRVHPDLADLVESDPLVSSIPERAVSLSESYDKVGSFLRSLSAKSRGDGSLYEDKESRVTWVSYLELDGSILYLFADTSKRTGLTNLGYVVSDASFSRDDFSSFASGEVRDGSFLRSSIMVEDLVNRLGGSVLSSGSGIYIGFSDAKKFDGRFREKLSFEGYVNLLEGVIYEKFKGVG